MTSTLALDAAVADSAEADVDASDSTEPVDPTPGGVLRGLSLVDLWVLGALFLWPCAYLPIFATQAWTPRVMALIVAVPTGGLAIWSLLRRRDRAAMFATAALCWALVGAAFSGNVILSLKGVVSTNSSVLIYAGSIGFWATARFMSARGRTLVAPLFVTAGLVNLLVGVIQVVFRIDSTSVSLVGDRAVGLLGNSMLFGTVAAAAGAMAVRLAASREHPIDSRVWLAAAFALPIGTAISGSRVAMIAVIVAALAGVIGAPRARAAISVGAAVAGVIAGSVLTRVVGGEADSLSRLSRSGTGGRTTVWRASADAVLERPVTGWGLGRFRYALQGRYSLEDLAAMPHLPRFWDAHNVVIELAVLVGIPGLILFGGFAWCAGRRSAPAMVVAAVAIVITWLLQPTSYQTLPIAMILLGAGTASASGTESDSMFAGHRRSIAGVAVALGVAPAIFLGVADARLLQAMQAEDVRGVESAAAMFVHDPMAANTAANAGWFEAASDPESSRVMFDALERTVEIEPENPYWWNELALAQAEFLGDLETARSSADRALELSPFDERAWITVWATSTQLDDNERRLEAADVLCRLAFQPGCDDLESENAR